MNKKELKVGIVQQSNSKDIDLNIQKLESNIRDCVRNGAELIVLQELHNSLYFCQTEDVNIFDLAETIPGSSTDRFGKIAHELEVVIVVSLFEKRAPGIYHNTAVVLDADGTIAGKYRKMHIPDDPGFSEKFYFTPGDLGFEPIQTSVGKLGVLVCWDQWYPEAARLMAMKGAEVLIYPTAIGWDPLDDEAEQKRQQDAWVISQRGHAVANGLPVISVNRVGKEESPDSRASGIVFWGHSFIAGPQGEYLSVCSSEGAENQVIVIDKARTEDVRRIWPFFRDRRIENYGDLTKRYLD